MKKMTALSALSAAAMAIPATTQAEAPPSDKNLSYRYTSYQEADAPRERTFTPELGRYQIEVHQLGYQTPIDESWYLTSELQFETLSGASPTQTYQDINGKSVLLMSGASIDEQRIDIKISPKRYFSEGTAGGLLALSTENDYQSIAAGVDGTLDLFAKHTTLIGSLSISHDVLSPTDPDLSLARKEADGRIKRSFSIYEGVNQIINKYSSIQVGVGFTRLSGYLSDPYKFEDRRPDLREQVTLSVQHKHFFDSLAGAALHSNYRYYLDDWGVSSHTLDFQWAQSITLGKIRIITAPLVRYYTQTQADFYSLEQNPADDILNSSDARLSSYGAFTAGLNNEIKFNQWSLHLNWQQYISREELALFERNSDEAPGLVNFTSFTAGIDYKF